MRLKMRLGQRHPRGAGGRLLGLLAVLGAAAVLAGCTTSEPVATASPTTTSVTATATVPAPTGTSTPAPTPVGTPPAGVTPPAGPTPPPGYAQSCAATYPWGQQVSVPFVCISEPTPDTRAARDAALEVSGYAGGSFENNVVIEARLLLPSGEPSSDTMAQTPVTYVAPDIGMPGFWRTTLHLAAGGQAGTLRVIAHFDSPRDGSVVAETHVDIALD